MDAFVGNRVHEALEQLFGDLQEGRLNRSDELRDFYASTWTKGRHEDVHVARPGETQDDYFEYGLECIDNFYRGNHPFNQSRTVGLDERVEFDLDIGGWRRFEGYIERVASPPGGTYETHDHKTSRSRRTPGSSELRQLSLYEVGLRSMHLDVTGVELVVHFLCRGEMFRRRQTRSELVQIVQEAHRVIGDIESERRFPARVTRLRGWCEFQEICPALRRG